MIGAPCYLSLQLYSSHWCKYQLLSEHDPDLWAHSWVFSTLLGLKLHLSCYKHCRWTRLLCFCTCGFPYRHVCANHFSILMSSCLLCWEIFHLKMVPEIPLCLCVIQWMCWCDVLVVCTLRGNWQRGLCGFWPCTTPMAVNAHGPDLGPSINTARNEYQGDEGGEASVILATSSGLNRFFCVP